MKPCLQARLMPASATVGRAHHQWRVRIYGEHETKRMRPITAVEIYPNANRAHARRRRIAKDGFADVLL